MSRRNRLWHHLLLMGGLLVTPLLLSACHGGSSMPNDSALDRSMRVPPEVIASWKETLAVDNIQLIQHGWRLTIIIPADNLFAVGSTELTPPAARILGEIARYLREYVSNTDKPFPIHVVGHTDITHARAGGLSLSQQNAQIVSSFLWHHGVPIDRMQVSGVGSTEPIANSTTRGMAINRRIVISIH